MLKPEPSLLVCVTCGLGTEKKQMGEADEGSIGSSSTTMNLSLQLDRYPRDLLQRFVSSCNRSVDTTPNEETEELELTLGLSLAGQFGVDKNARNRLVRSSSIAGLTPLECARGENSPTPPQGSFPLLMRTASLPTETEEEWRKRKELQMLRRMAAKKRRLEKQRSLNSKAEKDGSFGGVEAAVSRRACDAVASPFRLSSWVHAVFGNGDKGGSEGKGGDSSGVLGFAPQTSQGSAESQGGSSSGMSESDSRPKQGNNVPLHPPLIDESSLLFMLPVFDKLDSLTGFHVLPLGLSFEMCALFFD